MGLAARQDAARDIPRTCEIVQDFPEPPVPAAFHQLARLPRPQQARILTDPQPRRPELPLRGQYDTPPLVVLVGLLAAKPSKQSYEDDERRRVVLAAQRQFRAAWLRIGENTRLLRAWQAGELVEGSRDWRLGEVLDYLARTGDVPRSILPSGQPHVDRRSLLGGASPEKTWGRLFLSRMELTALAVLLTDRFAWNLKVYDRMPTPTAAPSVGEKASITYQVQVEKHRAGRGRWCSTE